MALETGTTISALNIANPEATDVKSQGPDHFYLIKNVLKTTFPGSGGTGFNTPITASEAEINKLDGLTASTAELNILDGVTATFEELNICDGLTATTAELNKVDYASVTCACSSGSAVYTSSTNIASIAKVQAGQWDVTLTTGVSDILTANVQLTSQAGLLPVIGGYQWQSTTVLRVYQYILNPSPTASDWNFSLIIKDGS